MIDDTKTVASEEAKVEPVAEEVKTEAAAE